MIKAEITIAAGGMFLLATLNMAALGSQLTKGEVKEVLRCIAKGENRLDKAYEQTMKRIKSQEENRSRLAQRVLACIFHAKRPLSTAELQDALAVRPSMSTLDRDYLYDVETVLSVCAGLIRLYEKNQIIDLIHKTTRDYFEMTKETWFPNAETEFTTTYVTYLSFDEFKSGPCQTDNGFEERLRLYPLYGYAAHNWGHHARKALTLGQEVIDFLECKAKVEASNQALIKNRGRSGLYYSKSFPKRMTGLHLAAYFGLGEAAKALLNLDHDPNSKDSYGRTPLSWAAKIGHEAVVKRLLEKAVTDVNPSDSDGCTPLWDAARKGDEVITRMLLQGGATANVKRVEKGYIYSYGESRVYTNALHEAAKHGHKVVTSLLLEYGAPIDEPSEEIREVDDDTLADHTRGFSGMHSFTGFGGMNSFGGFGRTNYPGYFSGLDYFLQDPIHPRHDSPGTITVTTTERTAICLATEKGHDEIMQLLAKKGAKRVLVPTSYESVVPKHNPNPNPNSK
ncbi:hypothetical protein FOMG_19457 [Fusarium oxysporum f. sp. melonis 26406]|uniref:GPI inositol-deacylase winged helix domain-containing protein n=1 Tax=Fusarium oxysporum f. sp. melonis 26406 TaxID=1089452 RepID=W9Z582_FUSOX|nr:hypothetical protein FOMG_19457 [Fusarium oxysporum f. sp. melonis 26406]